MTPEYHALKSAAPTTLILFRMGDFYELFNDDARTASKALGITLTKRKGADGVAVPMCGVPAELVDGYATELAKAGHAVAVCEPTPRGRRGQATARVVTNERVSQ